MWNDAVIFDEPVVFETDEPYYTQCRSCLNYTFLGDEIIPFCENCNFCLKTEQNKKLFMTPTDKMKYVGKLLRFYKREIRPNHYIIGFSNIDSLLLKYKHFLSFLYLRNGRSRVQHQYFISKLLNTPPKKINAELDNVWDEFNEIYKNEPQF